MPSKVRILFYPEITDLILLDVTPLSLGVETMGGLMTTIITRNSSIPVKQSEIFSTGADSQETVEIHVLQGERSMAKDNKSLGLFKLKGIPPAPRGIPRINVTFQLDVNGLLSVSAREEETGLEQSIRIEGASTLSRDDVSKMIKVAEENAVFDKSKKALINITYEFDGFLTKVEKLDHKISKNDSNAQIYFNKLIGQLKNLYNSNKISSFKLTDIKNAINFLILEYLNK